MFNNFSKANNGIASWLLAIEIDINDRIDASNPEMALPNSSGNFQNSANWADSNKFAASTTWEMSLS